jgi:hypothetical protein
MNSSAIPCRVCQHEAPQFFVKRLRRKYDVSYHRCTHCGHVQTETPYWLDETYSALDFRGDTGMVERSISTGRYTIALAKMLEVGPEDRCLDWGAGTGLFVRFCRDHGLNYFYADRYSKNIFALGFEAPPPGKDFRPKILTAFEVAEHYPDPLEDFKEPFAYQPDYFFLSTVLHRGEGPDWWYFLEDGQHVAIYTEKSLAILGEKFGYRLITNGENLHLFSREKLSSSLLKKVKRRAKTYAQRYRKRHGSKTDSDAQAMRSSASY